MDIVVISVDNSSGKPKPIAKIMNYGKFKYERKKRNKENKEKQSFTVNREIRLTLGINIHDLKTKAKKAREFLLNGDRVKVSLKLRGRENIRPEFALEVLNKFFSFVEIIAKITKEAQKNANFVDMYLERDKKKFPNLVSSKQMSELEELEKTKNQEEKKINAKDEN